MRRYEVISREWDHNGSTLVEVRDHGCNVRSVAVNGPSAYTVSAARRVARKTDPHARWTRFVRVIRTEDGGIAYRFTVSRLDPSYR